MTNKTHIAFNVAIISALAATRVIDIHHIDSRTVGLICGMIIGGMLPDIDNPNSKIRHAIRRALLPKGYRRLASRMAAVSSSFHHRKNCTHWPLFWLITCSILYLCFLSLPPLQFFIIGVAVGTEAHLLCDMFNPYGIIILAPISKRRWSLAKIPTNSIGEILFLFLSILTSSLLIVSAF